MTGFATIVLAGGASSRMGRAKALLPFGAETLIERVVRRMAEVSDDIIVVSSTHLALPSLPAGARVVEDTEPLLGPLSGIRYGLRHSASDVSFICGCDHPFLSPAVARFLVDRCRSTATISAVWASSDDSPQPLVGAYRSALLPVIEAMLASGRRRVIDLPNEAVVQVVPPAELLAIDPAGRSWVDVDTPEAYEAALRELASPLRIFVYGTLKRGGRFHDRYCRGAISIERATVRGRVHMLPAGYPALEVAAASRLAEGTASPLADVVSQDRFDARAIGAAFTATSGWQDVPGELMTFDDPAERLPPIDALEEFDPGGPSLYRRALLPILLEDGRVVTAWVYVGEGPPR